MHVLTSTKDSVNNRAQTANNILAFQGGFFLNMKISVQVSAAHQDYLDGVNKAFEEDRFSQGKASCHLHRKHSLSKKLSTVLAL